MIQTPIETEPEPEPDIRRFSSSNHSNTPATTTTADTPIEQISNQPRDKHHGDSNPRLERPQPIHPHPNPNLRQVYDEKSTEYLTSTDVTRASTGDSIDREKAALDNTPRQESHDVPVSRPTSNRPKARDFAVANITQPIRRATEKLVPAKRDGPPDVAFALPPHPRRVGSPDSAAAAQRAKRQMPAPGFKQSLVNTLKTQRVLWVVPILLPISWGLHFSHQSATAVFVASLLAIIPLAGGLSFATEELAHRVGDAWGGLLNATFGNAVELLVAILALVKGDIDIVQASMVGSILSNVLLVLGMSYFAGGLRFHEQLYGVVGAQMHISLLGITLTAIVLPAAYHYAFPGTQAIVDQTRNPYSEIPEGDELNNLLKMSRGLSFILLAVYCMFLCFQLWTHAYLFRIPRGPPVQHPLPGPKPTHETVFPRPNWVPSIADTSSSSSSSSHSTANTAPSRFRKFRRWSKSTTRDGRVRSDSDPSQPSAIRPAEMSNVDEEANIRGVELPHPHAAPPDIESPNFVHLGQPNPMDDDENQVDDYDHHQPQSLINFWFALGLLTVMTALAGVTAEFLVDSIDGLTETGNVSREFVGLILLPAVVGNSCEHVTAVIVSVKDKLNLSMSIAVGSSIQVSLCILPILVLIGWAIGQPMMLFFDTFETITLVISVLLVNFAISDGRTNYLEGFIMMMAYVSIALVTWFYDPISSAA